MHEHTTSAPVPAALGDDSSAGEAVGSGSAGTEPVGSKARRSKAGSTVAGGPPPNK